MVIVVKDTEEPKRRHGPGRSRHGAMIVAIVALAIAGGAWFWLTRQPQASYGAPHGVIVAGIGTFIAALIAQIRSMSALEMLEALWDALAWLIALVFGATVFALKAVWSWFLALIGWD
jgi:hypothetical protein